jgi:hypothetical protein
MFKYRKLCTLALALAAAGVAHATQAVKVTLSEPADAPADQTGKIEVTLTNTGDEPVDINKPESPFAEAPVKTLAAAVLEVRDARGRRVTYWGETAKYGGFSYDDFIHLLPGQSVSKTIDLSISYDFSSGTYTVQWTADYSTKRPQPGKISQQGTDFSKRSASNVLQFVINEKLLTPRPKHTAPGNFTRPTNAVS